MINEFLKKHGQSSDNIDAEKSLACFLAEMKAGLAGKSSSLAMIPTYLYEPDLSAKAETDKRIVIDAGGTNFRSACGYFDKNGKAVFEGMHKTKMPASDRELSKEEFYGAIADNIVRLLPETKDIGFCFSYPVDMEEDKDGIVGTATKEIKAPGISGTKVGACTLEAVKKYDSKQRKIVILNDTVATLLGGMASVEKGYSAFVGYIYGTGTNVCYTEKAENISKINATACGRRMLINTECGNFNGFAQGDYDKIVSAGTEYPDRYLFEKMTSGKYLSEVINLCIGGAVKEGLVKGGKSIPDFQLKDVSGFLNGEENIITQAFADTDDREKVKGICLSLIDRAAKMGAIVNPAVAIVSGKPDAPVAIVAEGTTFNKLPAYRKKFEEYLAKFLAPYNISFEIVQGEDLNMLGSLMATVA